MELRVNNPDSFTTVVDEAVAQYEDGEPATTIAYVVKETNNAERGDVLDAIANELDSADLNRLEKRELFLIRRQRALTQIKKRMGECSSAVNCSTSIN